MSNTYLDTVMMEQAVDFNQTFDTDVNDHVEDRWYFVYAAESTARLDRGYVL